MISTATSTASRWSRRSAAAARSRASSRANIFRARPARTRADYEAVARANARSSYHPVGTCKMGVDAMAVVDPAIAGARHRGACASATVRSCRNVVSSNTNAPTIAIAEKAADIIRGKAEANMPKIVSAAAAANAHPRRRHRHRDRRRRASAAPTRCWRRSASASPPSGIRADLTTLHPIAAGDMYGIKGIDHLAQAGPARPHHRRLLSVRPVDRRAAADLADDRPQRDRRLQRAVRHPVRHASARRRQSARAC